MISTMEITQYHIDTAVRFSNLRKNEQLYALNIIFASIRLSATLYPLLFSKWTA